MFTDVEFFSSCCDTLLYDPMMEKNIVCSRIYVQTVGEVHQWINCFDDFECHEFCNNKLRTMVPFMHVTLSYLIVDSN